MNFNLFWRIFKTAGSQRQRKKIILSLTGLVIVVCGLFMLLIFDTKGGFISLRLRFPIFKNAYKITKIFDLIYLPYFFVPDKIDSYELVVEPQDVEKINADLPTPQWVDGFYKFTEILNDRPSPVDAKFVAHGHQYNVKVSYRGDLSDHWWWDKKSWRIDFNKNDLFEGRSSINLIIPDDRGYVLEQFNNYRASKLGLFTPESRFVKLNINGRDFGLYWETEQWSTEMLERAELRSDTDLYGGADQFFESDKNIYSSILYWKKFVSNPYEKFESYTNLSSFLRVINNNKASVDFESILDMNNFYNWNIHQILIGSFHQNWNHNIRLYWDIEIGKFKFIPWDVGVVLNPGDFQSIDYNYNPVITTLMQSDDLRTERDKRLWLYVKDEKNLSDDLKYYDSQYQLIKPTLLSDFKKRDYSLKAVERIKEIRRFIKERYSTIMNILKEINIQGQIQCDVPQKLVTFELNVNNHSALTLNRIVLNGSSKVEKIYNDINDNRLLDATDPEIRPEQIELISNRNWDIPYQEAVKPVKTSYRYFVSIKDLKESSNFLFSLSNQATGEQTEINLNCQPGVGLTP